jgi:hypothetical protein
MMAKVAVTTVALFAVVAHAGELAGESPRNMMLEVKVGPYLPLVDRGFANVEGAYSRIFHNKPMVLGEAAFEYQFFQQLGSLAGGLSVGYASVSGSAIDTDTQQTVAQTTALTAIPVKGYVAYRFDWLSQKKNLPVVPYLKAGVVALHWAATNGSGVEVHEGQRGSGLKWGAVGVVGLSLQLDFLDPRLARDFDTGMGVNHSYLFAEYALQEVNNFGTKGSKDLDFSSRHWMFGLALEF